MTDSNLMIEVNGAHFRALHATAAADDRRYYLCAYYLRREADGRMTLTATDGHGLTQVPARVVNDEYPIYAFDPLIIARMNKAPRKTASTVTLEILPDRRTVVTQRAANGRVLDTTALDAVDAKYPDIDPVIPTEWHENLPEKFCFSPVLVSRVTGPLDNALAFFQWTGDDGMSAFKVVMPSQPDVLAIVMPARR